MTDAEIIERRKVWRHFLQTAFAEQEARQILASEQHANRVFEHRVDRAQQRLDAEGARLDAAIDALDETLASAPEYSTTRPMEGG